MDAKKEIKLKVQLGENKLVVPVFDLNAGLLDLMAVIAQRFEVEIVKGLRTVDGFMLDSNDTIGSVLRDGETVIAEDTATYADLYKKYITWSPSASLPQTVLIDITRPDTPFERSIQAGWIPVLKKFFVRVFQGAATHMELLTRRQLTSLKEGSNVVIKAGERNQSTEWQVGVSFLAGKDGKANAIELLLKSSLDPRPEIKRRNFEVIKTDVVFQEKVKLVQSFLLPLKAPETYTLPQETKEGPAYSEEFSEDMSKDKVEPPANLPTKEKKFDDCKADKAVPFAWVQCDDFTAKARYFVLAFIKDDWRGPTVVFCLENISCSRSLTYNLDEIQQRIIRPAEEKKQTEFVVDSLSYHHPSTNNRVTTTALIDGDNNRIYAFQFHIKTQTSSVTKTCIVPWPY